MYFDMFWIAITHFTHSTHCSEAVFHIESIVRTTHPMSAALLIPTALQLGFMCWLCNRAVDMLPTKSPRPINKAITSASDRVTADVCHLLLRRRLALLRRHSPSQKPSWKSVQDARLRLPRPGNYTAKFTVTTLLKGGVNMEISKTIHYKAVAGDVHSCSVGGLPGPQGHQLGLQGHELGPQGHQLGPQGHQLGLRLTSLYLEFKDSCGNFCRLSSEPDVTLSSQQLALRLEAAPQWAEPEPGRHRLILPAVSVTALDSLVQECFTAPYQPASIASSVAVTGTVHRQAVSLQQDFELQVLPGTCLVSVHLTLCNPALKVCLVMDATGLVSHGSSWMLVLFIKL